MKLSIHSSVVFYLRRDYPGWPSYVLLYVIIILNKLNKCIRYIINLFISCRWNQRNRSVSNDKPLECARKGLRMKGDQVCKLQCILHDVRAMCELMLLDIDWQSISACCVSLKVSKWLCIKVQMCLVFIVYSSFPLLVTIMVRVLILIRCIRDCVCSKHQFNLIELYEARVDRGAKRFPFLGHCSPSGMCTLQFNG